MQFAVAANERLMLELPCPAVSALEACASSLLVTRVKELAFCLVAR